MKSRELGGGALAVVMFAIALLQTAGASAQPLDRQGRPNYVLAPNGAPVLASAEGANAIAAKAAQVRMRLGWPMDPHLGINVAYKTWSLANEEGAVQWFGPNADVAIVWSRAFGAFLLHGDIAKKYFEDRVTMANIGHPRTDELAGDPQGACTYPPTRSQRFKWQALCWTAHNRDTWIDGRLQPPPGGSQPPPLPPMPATVYIARAHATSCLNWDGSQQWISHRTCADGFGFTQEQADNAAKWSFSQTVCIGPQPGCCNVAVNTSFGHCGQ